MGAAAVLGKAAQAAHMCSTLQTMPARTRWTKIWGKAAGPLFAGAGALVNCVPSPSVCARARVCVCAGSPAGVAGGHRASPAGPSQDPPAQLRHGLRRQAHQDTSCGPQGGGTLPPTQSFVLGVPARCRTAHTTALGTRRMVSSILGDLKAQAATMGNEIDEQNDMIDRIQAKGESNDQRINAANNRTGVLLKNA